MGIQGFQEIDYESADVSKVRIGLLGCGFIGRVHSNAYLKIPFTYQNLSARPELTALCDCEGAEGKARLFNYKGYYTDWKRLVEDPNIDIIDNCTPDDMHYEPAVAAAENGKHVICEKPLAMTVDEAGKMAQAVKKAGIKSMCCHNYRFIPAVRMAKELIEKGVLGKIYRFRGCYLQEIGHDPQTPVENLWYASGTKSGILFGIGSHVIDIARFLVGEVKTVSGLVKTFNTSRKTASGQQEQVKADEGNVTIIEFGNGAIGTIESSGVSAGRKNQLTWEINAEKGSIAFDLEDLNHLHVYHVEAPLKEITGFSNVSVTEPYHPLQAVYLPPGHNSGWEYGHVHALKYFIDCVINDKSIEPYGASFEDGYRVQVIMEAIKESSRTGQKIEIAY